MWQTKSGTKSISLASLCVVLFSCSNLTGTRQIDSTKTPLRHVRAEELVPKHSSGRKPAGNRSDPFLAEGVIERIVRWKGRLPQILLKHREVPYFMVRMEMALTVSEEVLKDISEGDAVTAAFALKSDGSGYELFRIERADDSITRTNEMKQKELN
jgi:hypothetical protein